MAFFACIFVPDFPVEAFLRSEPELRSQPVAVLEGKAPLQRIFVRNEFARRSGVEAGMTKLQAEACPGLVLHDRSLTLESTAHAALLECAQSFSPRVEDRAPDTVLFDLAGLESLFGPVPQIARAIASRISALGLEANVATASNPDSAELAARGFSGVTVIPAGKEAEQLGSLPLGVLLQQPRDLDGERAAELLETFSRWGIRNLGALAALPDISVSERLGQEGVSLQRLARGETFRTLVPVEPPPIFEEAVDLEYPLVLLEPLAFLLGQLLEQLCSRLAAHALSTQELRLRLELEQGCSRRASWQSPATGDCARSLAQVLRSQDHLAQDDNHENVFERTILLPVPLLDPKVFLKLLQLDLKAHPPGAPIRKIHLAVEPARPRAAQGGLFLPPSPEPEKLELTLARIAGIVGEGRVGAVALRDTYHPEGFHMQRFAPAELPAKGGNSHSDQRKSHTVTALRMFRPALRATVTLRDGQPAYIVSSRRKLVKEGEVLWAAGPWRSSGDWWEREGWARDEWDIALQEESGIGFYRLIRDLLSGKWLLEGTYD